MKSCGCSKENTSSLKHFSNDLIGKTFKSNSGFFVFFQRVKMKLLSLALFGLVIAQTYAVNFFEVVVEEWELWKSVHRK